MTVRSKDWTLIAPKNWISSPEGDNVKSFNKFYLAPTKSNSQTKPWILLYVPNKVHYGPHGTKAKDQLKQTLCLDFGVQTVSFNFVGPRSLSKLRGAEGR